MTKRFEGKKNQILAQGQKFTEPVEVEDCDNCQLIDCEFDGSKIDEGDKMLNATNNTNCKFARLRFHDRKTGGVIFNMTGSKTKDNVIEECEWWNFTSKNKNGSEMLRIGLSGQADKFFDTIVRNNNFHDIKTKEPESISVKSSGNLIQNNKLSNNSCSITIRHGHTNEIRNNLFNGEGGIRVYGKNNKIEENVHRNNKSKDFPPLSLVNGNKPDEDLSAQYTQVKNNHVIRNTYEECSRPVIWGRDSGRKYKPSGVKFLENKFINNDVSATAIDFSGGVTEDDISSNIFEDNIYYGSKLKIPEVDVVEKGFKKGDANQPDPVVVPIPEEPEVVVPPVEEEEEEQPTEEHVPDNKPTAPMCAIHRHAEAKVIQQVSVCGEHAEYFRGRFKQLLQDTLNDAKAQEIADRDKE